MSKRVEREATPVAAATAAVREAEIETLPTYYTKVDWANGPDNICPATAYTTTKLSQPVKMHAYEPDMAKFPPLSIYSIFKQTVRQRPEHRALAFKVI